ncbi:MAG: hypothetical protein NC102_10430 [Clostridium sp.]|nr:hypothetical protein [Clostridium sp.]
MKQTFIIKQTLLISLFVAGIYFLFSEPIAEEGWLELFIIGKLLSVGAFFLMHIVNHAITQPKQ